MAAVSSAKSAAQDTSSRAGPNGHGSKASVPEFSKEQELVAYRDMLAIRRFEEKAGQMYGMGLIGGFCHLYIGQEAVVVGMQMALKPGDQVITGYRDHGHMLACGMDPERRDGRTDWPQKRLFPRQGRVDAYVLGGEGFLRRPRHRRERRCRSAPASLSPTAIAKMTMSA